MEGRPLNLSALKMENVRWNCPTEITKCTQTRSLTAVGIHGKKWHLGFFCVQVQKTFITNSRESMTVDKSLRFHLLKVGQLCPVS